MSNYFLKVTSVHLPKQRLPLTLTTMGRVVSGVYVFLPVCRNRQMVLLFVRIVLRMSMSFLRFEVF